MKKLILVIIALVTMFAASLTFNSNRAYCDPVEVVVFQPHVKIIMQYDGPGGKLVSVLIEHVD